MAIPTASRANVEIAAEAKAAAGALGIAPSDRLVIGFDRHTSPRRAGLL